MATLGQLASQLAKLAHKIRETHGDMYAQTVPYSLLIRRWYSDINIESLLAGFEDREAISRIEETLDSFDLASIRTLYEAESKDPSVYFYEEFLRAYDPASSRGRGVLYTPPEVVGYMIRCVSSILKDRFDQSMDDAFIIDPCCGVGTFLWHIEHCTQHHPRMLGMELMPAPCAIASSLLHKAEVVQADWLSQQIVDTNGRLPVILGNPPYSGHSSNAGKISNLMADYREGLNERNPKWLQDDYVKFIRMAQQQIESAGQGIVAFITNHSFIFNPTFRAMRTSLANTFDEMFILDLGGNMKRLDTQNQNVFPIQMGVAISFLVKTSMSPTSKVQYTNITGSRKDKLEKLANLTFASTPWEEVPLTQPFHLFTPNDARLSSEFYSFPSLFDIFEQSTIGFVTSRDAFAIGFTREEVLTRIAALRDGQISDQCLREEYAIGDLDIESARRELLTDPNWQDKAIEILYRPFDRRWAYYSRAIMERPRLPFMQNLMQENVALAIGRAGQVTGSDEWDVVFCTNRPTDLNLFRRGGAKLFPRYVYENGERHSNMKADFTDPDALFNYIYALLHSSIYRSRYAQLLGIDYPRIPIPKNEAVLIQLADLGLELMNLHLQITPLHPSSKPSSMRIGGYEIPEKRNKERAHIDSDKETAQIASAVSATLTLRARIDDIIANAPPW